MNLGINGSRSPQTQLPVVYIAAAIMFALPSRQAGMSSIQTSLIRWHGLITWVHTVTPLWLLTTNLKSHLNLDSYCGFLFELHSASDFSSCLFRFFPSFFFFYLFVWNNNVTVVNGVTVSENSEKEQKEEDCCWCGGVEELSQACTTVGLTFRQFSTACSRWWSGSTFAFRAWNYTPSDIFF